MKLSKLREYLNNLDDKYDNYDVVYFDTSCDSICCITKTNINNKDEEIQLTNNNKYKWNDR